jgi:hypothetical protein
MSKPSDKAIEMQPIHVGEPQSRHHQRPRRYVNGFEHGEDRALESGATESRPDDVEVLTRAGEALAREDWEERYDPASNPHDALREAEHGKDLKDRTKLEEAARFSAAEVREAEHAQGAVPPAGEKPQVPPPLLWFAGAVMALSVAPTFRDELFASVSDDVIGWTIAMIAAGFVAAMVVAFTLLGHQGHAEKPAWKRRQGLIAGVGVAAACAIMRLRSAEGFGDVSFAAALTILELAVVLFLEYRASLHEEALRAWHAAALPVEAASRVLAAAKARHERQLASLEEVKSRIHAHVEYVESRTPRFVSVEEAIAATVKTMLDGYHSGLAKNRGYLLGAPRRRV